MNVLDKELATYREKLPSLLLEEGKFALVHLDIRHSTSPWVAHSGKSSYGSAIET
jgi:hypothetical protein